MEFAMIPVTDAPTHSLLFVGVNGTPRLLTVRERVEEHWRRVRSGQDAHIKERTSANSHLDEFSVGVCRVWLIMQLFL